MFEPELPIEPPEDRIFEYCDRCGGEIYEYGLFYEIDGVYVCPYCLTDFAAEYFADCKVDEDFYSIEGVLVEDAALGLFAEKFFAGFREDAEPRRARRAR